ncbi:MAG: alkane 1-monooxygenase [Myxococcales bacterium]|nr:alkane 1-monooxygenase [Myxococcales bacterium]
MDALPYLIGYLIPAVAAVGLWLGGPYTFLGLAFTFGAIPALDALGGLDTANADVAGEAARDRNPLFNLIVRLWILPHAGLLVFAGWLALTAGWGPVAWTGAVLSVGVMSAGVGITIAHELMHRRGAGDRALGEALMTLSSYPHFCVEHVYGHHKTVATPDDPAFAPYGQSLYAFLPKTLIGGVRSAWRHETRRVARKAGDRLTWRDRRVRYPLDLLVMYGAVAWLGGPLGVGFFAAQSLVAMVLLELINYIEHYGLERRRLPSGKYEKVTPHHSWNSAHRVSKHLLFALPRHADHHANASRPYWKLRHFDDAPQMPAGYPSMVLLSLAPPLWFRVMNPRVRQWNASVAERHPAAPAQAPAVA